MAEGGGLLNRYTLQRRIEGSNPSVSATPSASDKYPLLTHKPFVVLGFPAICRARVCAEGVRSRLVGPATRRLTATTPMAEPLSPGFSIIGTASRGLMPSGGNRAVSRSRRCLLFVLARALRHRGRAVYHGDEWLQPTQGPGPFWQQWNNDGQVKAGKP